jgi:hypothetical protein
MIKKVFDEFFRVIGFFSTIVISYSFAKSAINGQPPEFPLSGDLVSWLVLAVAALAGAFIRQRKSQL